MKASGETAASASFSTSIYEIKLQGHITLDWSSWMTQTTATHRDDGSTIVVGLIQDQAALHGVLAKIRDLGLVILSVTRLPNHDSSSLLKE